jgi:hypothetical protein
MHFGGQGNCSFLQALVCMAGCVACKYAAICAGGSLGLPLTFCSYLKVAISKHFTFSQAETLIEAQNLI